MIMARRLTSMAGYLIVLAICAVNAWAQAYPAKPIQIIVPFAAGGSADFVGRLVGTKLSESLGQPVVINNRDGAGGVLGTQRTAQATPDGYTLQIGNNSTHGVNQVFNSKLPYDTLKDFTPVTIIVSSQQVLLTNTAVPAKSVKEFVALAKANSADFKQKISSTGAEPVASTPEACAASIRNELAMWTKFAKETGIRIE